MRKIQSPHKAKISSLNDREDRNYFHKGVSPDRLSDRSLSFSLDSYCNARMDRGRKLKLKSYAR